MQKTQIAILTLVAAGCLLIGAGRLTQTGAQSEAANAALPANINMPIHPGQTAPSSVNWVGVEGPIRFWSMKANCTAHWQTHQGLPSGAAVASIATNAVNVHIPKTAPKGAYQLKVYSTDGVGTALIQVR